MPAAALIRIKMLVAERPHEDCITRVKSRQEDGVEHPSAIRSPAITT